MRFQGRIVHVSVRLGEAEYRLLVGDPLPIVHYGKDLTLTADDAVTAELPPLPHLPSPSQPIGREPQSRMRD
jgi:alpha,alpha-trehalose phosphorylase